MPRSLHPASHPAPRASHAHFAEHFDAAHRAQLAANARQALLAAAGVTGVTLAIALALWVLYAFMGGHAGAVMP